MSGHYGPIHQVPALAPGVCAPSQAGGLDAPDFDRAGGDEWDGRLRHRLRGPASRGTRRGGGAPVCLLAGSAALSAALSAAAEEAAAADRADADAASDADRAASDAANP